MDLMIPLFDDPAQARMLFHFVTLLPVWFWPYTLAALIEGIQHQRPPWGTILLAVATLVLTH